MGVLSDILLRQDTLVLAATEIGAAGSAYLASAIGGTLFLTPARRRVGRRVPCGFQ